jgi:hypothetical protein
MQILYIILKEILCSPLISALLDRNRGEYIASRTEFGLWCSTSTSFLKSAPSIPLAPIDPTVSDAFILISVNLAVSIILLRAFKSSSHFSNAPSILLRFSVAGSGGGICGAVRSRPMRRATATDRRRGLPGDPVEDRRSSSGIVGLRGTSKELRLGNCSAIFGGSGACKIGAFNEVFRGIAFFGAGCG